MPKEKEYTRYQLNIVPALEKSFNSITFFFDTKEELEAAHNTVADTLLFIQDNIKAMPDYSNSFAKAGLINNKWENIE